MILFENNISCFLLSLSLSVSLLQVMGRLSIFYFLLFSSFWGLLNSFVTKFDLIMFDLIILLLWFVLNVTIFGEGWLTSVN